MPLRRASVRKVAARSPRRPVARSAKEASRAARQVAAGRPSGAALRAAWSSQMRDGVLGVRVPKKSKITGV
jgi:hypothetical protein